MIWITIKFSSQPLLLAVSRFGGTEFLGGLGIAAAKTELIIVIRNVQ